MIIPKQFTFNKEVSKNFDNHVREQLPWYESATALVANLALSFIPNNGVVYDIGCSTGNMSKALSKLTGNSTINFVNIGSSPDMEPVFKGVGEIIIKDAVDVVFEKCDVVICFLSVMFLSKNDRVDFLNKAYNALKIGGCLIIVDKKQSTGTYIDLAIYRATLKLKLDAGATPREVIEKELSLRGAQRPLDDDLIKEFDMHQFFQFGDFVGFIKEKVRSDFKNG